MMCSASSMAFLHLRSMIEPLGRLKKLKKYFLTFVKFYERFEFDLDKKFTLTINLKTKFYISVSKFQMIIALFVVND